MATKTSGHKHPITGTARMLCRAGSRHLSSVRPSVRPSVCPGRAHSSKPAAAGVLLWARPVKKHKTLKTYFCHPWFGVESLVDPRNRVVGTQIPRAKGAIFFGGGAIPIRCGLAGSLLWARSAGDIDRLLHGAQERVMRRTNAGSAT